MGPRESLNAYLKQTRGIKFQWGLHDCLTFTNNAFHTMYGKGWADDWLGRYMVDGRPMKRYELKKEFGFSNFISAVDARLDRIDHVPPLGALVLTRQAERWIIGGAMGICTGTKCVFLSKQGVLHLPLDAVEQAWIKR